MINIDTIAATKAQIVGNSSCHFNNLSFDGATVFSLHGRLPEATDQYIRIVVSCYVDNQEVAIASRVLDTDRFGNYVTNSFLFNLECDMVCACIQCPSHMEDVVVSLSRPNK